MTEWYYAEGQQRQGPLPVQEIRQRFQRGQLNLDTPVSYTHLTLPTILLV